jgi:hypothetical protein
MCNKRILKMYFFCVFFIINSTCKTKFNNTRIWGNILRLIFGIFIFSTHREWQRNNTYYKKRNIYQSDSSGISDKFKSILTSTRSLHGNFTKAVLFTAHTNIRGVIFLFSCCNFGQQLFPGYR